jgi:ATP adenylyltransferase
MERLWTPWRMRYVGGGTSDGACIFCVKPASADDVAQLIVYRGSHAFVIMNLYPYNTGHLMVVPYAHVDDLSRLTVEARDEMMELLAWVTTAQRRVLHCAGFNIGLNLGRVAGAGVAEHLHIHVVPRWEGDANFMPILANTMVLPELIPVTYAKLRAELELSQLGKPAEPMLVPQAGAVVYLTAERKFALRRARAGDYVLPKGHVEPGEAAWQTAVREIDEEMGLRAEIVDWAGTGQLIFKETERLVAYFIAHGEPGSRFANHLGVDTFLFDPAEALTVLSFDNDRALLQLATQRLSLGFETSA